MFVSGFDVVCCLINVYTCDDGYCDDVLKCAETCDSEAVMLAGGVGGGLGVYYLGGY